MSVIRNLIKSVVIVGSLHLALSMQEEKDILLHFADEIDPNRTVLYNWNKTTNVCSFWGVGCDIASGSTDVTSPVTSITLPPPSPSPSGEAQATGGAAPLTLRLDTTTPFVNLKRLSKLWFSDPHAVTGALPDEYADFPSLSEIIFAGVGVQVQGSLPPRWGNSTTIGHIEVVNENGGRLTGSLPPYWSKLNSLSTLKLEASGMKGELPQEWSNLIGLEVFEVTSKNCSDGRGCFSGPVPPAWANLLNLQRFTVLNSELNGTLPPEWSKLMKLETMQLSNSLIGGTLPAEWSSWGTRIQVLDLEKDSISGSIPQAWVDGNMKFQKLILSGNQICKGSLSSDQLKESLCAQDVSTSSPLECLKISGTPLMEGTSCSSSGGQPNLLVIALSVLAVFLILLVGGLCLLNFLHRKRKRRPLVPLFSTARFSQARGKYESYLRSTQIESQAVGLTQAGGNRKRAEDALNPDLWDTQFLDQFDTPAMQSAIQSAANTKAAKAATNGDKTAWLSPFAATNIQNARDVGSYWPAEKTDVIMRGQKTPEELAAAEAERKRLEAEEKHKKMLATTHEAVLSMFGVVMMGVDDFYGKEKLLEEENREHPRCPTWSGGFPSLVPQSLKNTQKTSALFKQPSIKPLPALWRLGSFEVHGSVDLDVDFQKDVQPYIEERIGGGAFGDVYRGTFKGQPTAIKLFSRYYQGDQEEIYNSFVSEVKLMSKFQNCDRIVRILGASLRQPYVCILLEYCPGPSLASRIYDDKAPPLTYKQILELGHDIATALAYLHPTVVHRDLKPDNILLDGEGRAKLIDFGISRGKDPFKSYIMTQTGGTPIYMAPEQFNSPKFDEKADVYALGCILYEMYSRTPPWKGYSHFCQIIVAVAFNNERPPIPEDCPDNLRRLIQKCWRQESSARPSCAEIVRLLEIMLATDRETPRSEAASGSRSEMLSLAGSGAVLQALSSATHSDICNSPHQTPDLRAVASSSTVAANEAHGDQVLTNDDETLVDGLPLAGIVTAQLH